MKTDALIQNLVDHYGDWCMDEYENHRGGTARFTQTLYPYTNLFAPIQCNTLTIKNRTVMAPMGNCQMAEESGRPNTKMLQYFFARATGGVGLLTTGLIPVSHGIDGSVTERGNLSYFPRIDRSRTNASGWRDLAVGVHARGSRVFIQLTPGLGRVGSPECLINKFQMPVSASWNPNFYLPDVPCRPLTDIECNMIIKSAGQCAANAKVAGIDGVYLHGHEGYLLDQLTSTAWNRRKLGKYTDPQRFGVDLIKELRRRVGPYYPIMYRIDLSTALNETYGDRMNTVTSLKKFKNQRTVQDTLDYMVNLVKAGVDMFDVDLGCYDNWWLPHPPSEMPAGCFLEVSKCAKNYFAKIGLKSNLGIPVPIVAVGKLGYPDMAEQALRDGMCDLVMLGRPVLADPDWCKKAYAGDVAHIRPCLGCQEGCVNEFVDGGHPQCAVNSRTGLEEQYPITPPPAEIVKNIAVVGGGPAGLNFAIYAANRGHKITLFEREDRVGGKLWAAGLPVVKYDVNNYMLWLINTYNETKGITTKLNTEANLELLKEGKFDAIVYAIGAVPGGKPPIPGIDSVKYIWGDTLMCHPEKYEDLLKDAKKIVVCGGGQVGVECAYWLSYEKGKNVKCIEMMEQFMDGACTANRGHLIHYLEKNGVELINCSKVSSFKPGKVVISRNVHKNVPDPYCTWTPIVPKNIENPLAKKVGVQEVTQELDADLVILALGGRPNDKPYYEAVEARIAPEVYNIGDSFIFARVLEGNRAAYHLAIKI
ncbi:MAG: FAD-dependent oxidoreductase [Oscillospiraceae bacterium]